MNSGIFRVGLLFVAGTARAWYLYLVCALLGAAFLVTAWMGQRAGDLTDAIEVAAVINGGIWLVATVGMLATLRELREVRGPYIYRKALQVLGLTALFTIIMPAALLVLAGTDGFQLSTTCHIFMTLVLGAASGVLIATLPFPIVTLGMIFGPQVAVFFPQARAQFEHNALWQSPWRIEALALLALFVVAWRCSKLIRNARPAASFWSSMADMRVNVFNLLVAAGKDPDAAYKLGPAWALPSSRARAGASLWTRISILMGPPFAPGTLRQILSILVAMGGLAALGLWIFLQQLPERFHQIAPFALASMIPFASFMFLSPLTRAFAGRLRMVYRPQSADLAELALLPGLGGERTSLANYCLVISGRPMRMLAVITAILGFLAMMLTRVAPWGVLLMMLIVAGLAVVESSRFLATGRPFLQNVFAEVFAQMAVMFSIGALAFLSGIAGILPRRASAFLHSAGGIAHAVIPVIAAIVLLAAVWYVRRAYTIAGRLPHPFLEAQERRVTALL